MPAYNRRRTTVITADRHNKSIPKVTANFVTPTNGIKIKPVAKADKTYGVYIENKTSKIVELPKGEVTA